MYTSVQRGWQSAWQAPAAGESISTVGQVVRHLSRTANLLRYHRPHQWTRRLWNQIAYPVERRWLPPRLRTPPPLRQLLWNLCPRQPPPRFHSEELANGNLTLLNLTATVGNPIDWQGCAICELPLLWQFELQYHEFLAWSIAQCGNAEAWNRTWAALAGWMDTFHPTQRRWRSASPSSTPFPMVAWHPYCISRRIPVWIWLLSQTAAPPKLHGRLMGSLASQVTYLERHLETDLGGNHLWENAKAVLLAGAFFGGRQGDAWLRRGIRWLDRCTSEQVSIEGEHFERAIGYGQILADGLQQMARILNRLRPRTSQRYRRLALRMHDFNDRLRHPDGCLPLFGDTVTSPAPSNWTTKDSSCWVGEYYVHRRGRDALVFDAGDMAADSLPAHAHCDLLGFELSASGQRVFVDSGVYCYEGPKRHQYRCSKAHNVLVIDDHELADTWSSFRMGRRGHVRAREAGLVSGGHWIRATHDAFAPLGIEVCERIWLLMEEGPWFCLHRVVGAPGRAYHLREYLHCAPGISSQQHERLFTLATVAAQHRWEPLTAECTVALEPSSFSPDFYREEPNQTLTLQQRTTTPTLLGWCLHRTPETHGAKVEQVADGVRFQWRTGEQERSAVVPCTPSRGSIVTRRNRSLSGVHG